MRKIVLLITLVVAAGYVSGQDISVNDLLEFSSFSSKKFDSHISKKGFTPAGSFLQNDTTINTWQKAQPSPDSAQYPILRRISKQQVGEELFYSFQTSSKQEYLAAIHQLSNDGFTSGSTSLSADTAILFQKKEITVRGWCFTEDSINYFSLFFHRKKMPSARSIQYGDDLLQFTSHEYLSSFFGSANVRKDLYYFGENEINRCSVLFPNTPRQAVFIWEDEANLNGLSYIIIGGSIRTAGSSEFSQTIRENSWMLANGIRYNMRLEELVDLNGQDFSFFGRNSDYFLLTNPQNKGEIDFSSTGIVLDCINCGGASLLDSKKVSATQAVEQGLRLHVGMVMLFPGKQNAFSKRYASR